MAPHALGVSAAGAFVGALASALLVFFVSLYAGASRLTIVLAGMALTSIFTAGMNAILIFKSGCLRELIGVFGWKPFGRDGV